MIDIEFELQQIGELRETKGQEQIVLDKISRLQPIAAETSNFPILAKLCWEKAFVYQHFVMSHVDESANLLLMETAALEAHRLVTDHNLLDLVGDDTRFLGRVSDYKQDYLKAFEYYQQSLKFYQAQNHPRVLEIQAFISANLIYQHKIDEGLDLAKNTHSQFEISPLKESDFYRWAVWKTGIYPRVVKALIAQGADFDHRDIITVLESDQKFLQESGLDFQFRLDEINEALLLLK